MNKSEGESTIKHKYTWFIKIILFIVCTVLIYLSLLYNNVNLDELWSFSFAHNIYKGLIPYKDFNMVIFPFFPYIMAPFASKLYIYRILEAILNTTLIYIIVYITNRYNKSKISLIFITILFMLKVSFWPLFTYNELMCIFILLSFISIKKYLEKNKPLWIFLSGLFLSLALVTKQSVSAAIILALTPVLFIYLINNKKIKDFGLYTLGGVLPVFCLIITAIINGYLYEMIDLAILGLSSFNTIMVKTFSISYVFYIFLFICTFIIGFKYISSKKLELIDYIIFVYIISFYLFANILRDCFHSILALIVTITIFSTFQYKNYIKNIIISFIIIVAFILQLSYPEYQEHWNLNAKSTDWVLFENVYFDETFIKNQTLIVNYTKQQQSNGFNVVNCSLNSIATSLILNKSNGYLDLVVKGNLGIKGIERVIKEIEEHDIILLSEKITSLYPEETTEYIKNNYILKEKLNTYPDKTNVFVKP